MFRRTHRRLLSIVAVGLAGSVAFADSPKKPDPKTNRPVVVTPLSPAVIADAVRAEQDAVLRRYSICDRLRKLGEETNNSALVQQAADLEAQAKSIYDARVARLGVRNVTKADEEPTVPSLTVAPPAPVAAEGSK
ncbi:MAG: hypothetical protein U0798_02825 [Gemmataceae bacterium]